MILAGDVGGTKTALALFESAGDGLAVVNEATLQSQEFPSLEAVLGRFLDSCGRPPLEAACFGVAGAVVGGRSRITNLPWDLEEAALARAIGVARVKLLNDLEAAAHGVLSLPADGFTTLQAGRPRPGHRVLIAAGTGLGEAILAWDGVRHIVVSSEGGHTDFAPRSEREIELLRFLRRRFDHVSYERVLSGPGLHEIYRFLRASGRAPAWLDEKLAGGDPSAVISAVALSGDDPVCVEALDLFVSVYGAEAGNLALKALAIGGVYVGGGIAPKIRPKLEDGRFLTAFRDKGRFSPLMAAIPVALVVEPRAALLGAARVAWASVRTPQPPRS
ncbi:MAG TPA: glucokinase [Methylomirabilota bacterium]|jgi:glucokinase|nr:glucokinase [Methylomirabilota bacterium]